MYHSSSTTRSVAANSCVIRRAFRRILPAIKRAYALARTVDSSSTGVYVRGIAEERENRLGGPPFLNVDPQDSDVIGAGHPRWRESIHLRPTAAPAPRLHRVGRPQRDSLGAQRRSFRQHP
jgi:hypothetical protein